MTPLQKAPAKAYFRPGLVLLLLVLLNTLLGLFRILPERLPLASILPGVELTIVVVALCFLPRRPARRFAWFAATLLVVLAVYSVGESFYRYVYREPLDPYRDLSFVGPFFAMVTGIEGLTTTVVAIVALAIVAVLAAILAGAMRRFAQAMGERGSTRWRAAIAVCVTLLLLIRTVLVPAGEPISVVAVRGLAGRGGTASIPPVIDPDRNTVTVDGESITEANEPDVERGNGSVDDVEPSSVPLHIPREPALGRSNLTILVVESYGHTLFSREDHNERIMPVYGDLGAYLEENGVEVYSAFVRSPAFGGRSWLADSTILSGEWLGNQELYDAVFLSPEPNLVRDLEDSGYWTAVFAPAMTRFDDYWLDYLPFDEGFMLERLDYRGPVFEFGRLTDQFLLWRVSQEVSAARAAAPDRPAFAFVMMVSSHVPFRLVPPFVDDWASLGDGEIYNDLERTWFDNNWLTGGEYPDGYTTSIAYSLRAAVEYAVRFAEPDELVVIVGDHQPRIPISEQESTFSVPMHFLSRDAALLADLESLGFDRGIVARTDPEFMWMNEVYPLLMDLMTDVTPRDG